MNADPLLSAIVFLPLFGGAVILALRRYPDASQVFCLVITMVELLFVLAIPNMIPHPSSGLYLVEDVVWIKSLGIHYSLAMDGISYLLVLLTSFLMVLCTLVSWKEVHKHPVSFHAFLLFAQSSAIGVFLARDMFLFYLFWEIQLVPMFFLIGVWGHEERRKAAIKFVIFSIAGGLFMLLAVIKLYLGHGAVSGEYTFAFEQLLDTPVGPGLQYWLFGAFLFAFGIKTPIVPVHTWLPDAHTQAPTAGSVILAGVLLKTGTYAIIRWAFPLFPEAAVAFAPILVVLALAGLLYASWITFAQTDVKRLVAYSSIGHMALIVLGVAVWNRISLEGSLLQMINHGLTTSALFIMVGLLADRAGTREMNHFGGLWKTMPVFSGLFLFFGLASAGLPGLNNFVSELLILFGTFQARPVAGVIGFAGIVLTLAYTLRLIQGLLFGRPSGSVHPDLSLRELVILAPLVLAVLFLGIAPDAALDWLREPVLTLLNQLVTV